MTNVFFLGKYTVSKKVHCRKRHTPDVNAFIIKGIHLRTFKQITVSLVQHKCFWSWLVSNSFLVNMNRVIPPESTNRFLLQIWGLGKMCVPFVIDCIFRTQTSLINLSKVCSFYDHILIDSFIHPYEDSASDECIWNENMKLPSTL